MKIKTLLEAAFRANPNLIPLYEGGLKSQVEYAVAMTFLDFQSSTVDTKSN